MKFMQTAYAQAIFFTVFWTAFMWWWSPPRTTAHGVILVVCGCIAGALYGWLMGKFFARRGSRPER